MSSAQRSIQSISLLLVFLSLRPEPQDTVRVYYIGRPLKNPAWTQSTRKVHIDSSFPPIKNPSLTVTLTWLSRTVRISLWYDTYPSSRLQSDVDSVLFNSPGHRRNWLRRRDGYRPASQRGILRPRGTMPCEPGVGGRRTTKIKKKSIQDAHGIGSTSLAEAENAARILKRYGEGGTDPAQAVINHVCMDD
jgi:hypothetical protein